MTATDLMPVAAATTKFEPVSGTSNGKLNGHVNGTTNGHSNGGRSNGTSNGTLSGRLDATETKPHTAPPAFAPTPPAADGTAPAAFAPATNGSGTAAFAPEPAEPAVPAAPAVTAAFAPGTRRTRTRDHGPRSRGTRSRGRTCTRREADAPVHTAQPVALESRAASSDPPCSPRGAEAEKGRGGAPQAGTAPFILPKPRAVPGYALCARVNSPPDRTSSSCVPSP